MWRAKLAVVGFVLWALGCGGSSKPACMPDFTVGWEIVDSNNVGTRSSCGRVGATSIRATIDGQSMDFPCPDADGKGTIPVTLDAPGSYTFSMMLLKGGIPLGQASSGTLDVDCSSHDFGVWILEAPVVCTPGLTIYWGIVSNLDSMALTCAQAGNANLLIASISSGGLPVLDVRSECPPNATMGSLVAPLPAIGNYEISLQLNSDTQVLSQTPAWQEYVDCSGQTATPRADLGVNY